MLRHYNKAIGFLQHDGGNPDTSSIRVALLACVLFICLEQLRGRNQTAQEHLRGSIALLAGSVTSYLSERNEWLLRREVVDDEIGDVLYGLQSRSALLFPTDYGTLYGSTTCATQLSTQRLCSISQAKRTLDRLLSEACALAAQGHRQVLPPDAVFPSELEYSQQLLVRELATWLHAYQAFQAARKTNVPLYDEVQDHLLRSHHTMAWIIATCCLSTPQESAFDMHTNDFVSILTHSIPISKIRRSTSYESIHQKLYGSSLSQSTDHVIEMGWIPPLYYTALKCRIPHIRFQAIRLLERSPHREGVWAATTAVAIARRVMQMEDSESYGKLCKDAAFPWEALPAEEECVRPPLDEHCIVHDVQIVLPDKPMGKVAIRCKRMKSSEGWEFLESVYDVRSASWSEETEAAYADCQSDNVK